MASHRTDISSGTVLKNALGGAIGGWIAFTILDPQMRQVESLRRGAPDYSHGAATAVTSLMLGAVVGAAIGAALVIAEEVPTQRWLRLIGRTVLAIIIGGFIGCFGLLAANAVFTPFALTGIKLLIIVGRMLAWALMGTAAGLCPGILSGSRLRVLQAASGGFVGGMIGGVLFDLLGDATDSGSLPRLVGFAVTGLAIGAASALVTEIGKVFWLTALSGGREGRGYYLSKPRNTLGRDELADIPVFGDSSVQKEHATITCSFKGTGAGAYAQIHATGGAKVLVNGTPVQSVALANGDIIHIGASRFRFDAREGSAVPMPAEPGHAPQPIAPGYSANQVSYGSPVVQVVAGPHTGLQIKLIPGAIIGRDPRCDVALVGDNRLSRQHARFILENGAWILEDGGSTNGTYVNGVKVQRQPLTAGDAVQVGDSVLTFAVVPGM